LEILQNREKEMALEAQSVQWPSSRGRDTGIHSPWRMREKRCKSRLDEGLQDDRTTCALFCDSAPETVNGGPPPLKTNELRIQQDVLA
jgi:hypothetical protein